MKIGVTGSKGFIAGYVIEKLLEQGHSVVGIDNLSKYGPVDKSYDDHPNYVFLKEDVKDVQVLKDAFYNCDHLINFAAMIGGISYFHEFAYDLLAENERIMASVFDAAIHLHKKRKLQKITVLSSSMVYESTTKWPSKEGDEYEIAPPISTYGFQKLAVQYYCHGAWEQYKLPYTIVNPFNAVGTGEQKALCDTAVKSGNIELAMSHVVPDLIQKILKGQNPLHILGMGNQIRHYTYAGDLANGIISALFHPLAENESFNLSTPVGHTVIELAEIIWTRLNPNIPFAFVSDTPFRYDVQKRIPDVSKAKKVLGFEATTSLEKALDEIIPWAIKMIELGKL